MGGVLRVQHAEVDVPQPAGLAGEVFAADGVHDDDDGVGLLLLHGVAQGLVVGHGVLVLGGQQRTAHGMVLPVDNAAVLQHIVTDAAGNVAAIHAGQRAHGVARQNVVGVVDALEGQLDAVFAVDGEESGIQIRVGNGKGRLRAAEIASGAAVGADMVVVVVVVGHGRAA